MADSIIVTGCDARHHDLVTDLLASIEALGPRSFAVGFVNVGGHPLPPEISRRVDAVAEVADVGFEAAGGKGFRLGFLNVKPRLPQLFPGFERYAWLDGDTWVQDGAGIADVLHGAALGDICMAPEADPNYFYAETPRQWTLLVYRSLLGEAAMHAHARLPMLNSGVFSAMATSPIWDPWRETLARLAADPPSGAETMFSDQMPLHHLIHERRFKLQPLRTVNNWLAAMSRPMIDLARRRVVAPTWPHEEIRILHLTGPSKDLRFTLGEGGPELSFRYRDLRAFFDRL